MEKGYDQTGETDQTGREVRAIRQFMQAELERQDAQIKRSLDLHAKEMLIQIDERVNLQVQREMMPLHAELIQIRQDLKKQNAGGSNVETHMKAVAIEMEAQLQICNAHFLLMRDKVAKLEQHMGLASPDQYVPDQGVSLAPRQLSTPVRTPLGMPNQLPSLRGIGGDLGPAVRSIESEALGAWQDEFIFVADVRHGSTLGLHVSARNDHHKVEVSGLLPEGLAAEWNVFHPQIPIKVGDSIIAVNGVKGSSARILEQLRLKCELRLHIKRASE